MPEVPHGSEALRTALEASGRRPTRQREEIFAYLRRSDHHPTAEQVFEAVRRSIPNLSLATVYNALEALVDGGLVIKLPSIEGSARFDARTEGHYHLRCLRSGEVEDLSTPFDPGLIDSLDPELVDRLRSRGFRVTGYRLEVVGYYEGQEPSTLDDDQGRGG
jgi:Fe2+ or Zn2+ uptake regulation protein